MMGACGLNICFKFFKAFCEFFFEKNIDNGRENEIFFQTKEHDIKNS